MVWQLLALFALSGGLTLYSTALARLTHTPPSLWLTNGALIGWMIRKPLAQTWPLLVAGFFGYMVAKELWGDPLLTTAAWGLNNAVETLIVTLAIRRQFPVITSETPFPRLARVALISAAVACALSSLTAILIKQPFPDMAFWMSFNLVFRAHLLGMVIAGSASIVVAIKNDGVQLFRGKRSSLLWHLLLLTALSAAVFLVRRYPLLFLIYPPLLLLIFRHRFAGMILGIAIVALITTGAAALDIGPFDLVHNVTPVLKVAMAQIFIAGYCVVALPVALTLVEQDRLQIRLRESELRYRMLADNSGDLVMRIRPNGDRRYVSPSVKELLGWDVEEFMAPRPDLIHPDDRERVAEVVAALRRIGGSTTATYRLQHRAGHYLWIEAFARMVDSPDGDGTTEIIYTGRDVTQRVHIQQALIESQAQLKTITDNVPAVIARVDMSERYTYINRHVQQISGESPADILGKTVKEVRGAALYEHLKEYLDRAYAGESVWFEYEATYLGKLLHFQTHYVPDMDSKGRVRGLYALTTEITHIKNVERELLRLAHQDALTGLANRRSFNDQALPVLRNACQNRSPVLLTLLDVDNFKAINDTHGHAAGDLVLAEVGRCLQEFVLKGAVVARIGGDEFVVLCDHLQDKVAAEAFVHSLWETLHMAVMMGRHCIDVHLSMGAVFFHGSASQDVLMKLADEALYHAKESGRNTYRMVSKRLFVGEKNGNV
ncbi:diguanylate cyclase domain-containing protein [Dyella psychrodurans]|nr:diguanylate cyclase [Dyella psychrodurans]